jgi:glycosyltransferase involved in cell wall biosynthesis
MKYSIIIPTYNRSDFIIDCILSAINFSLESSNQCEVIVVDDCSTDNTVQNIIVNFKKYLENDLLKIITLDKNSGVVFARNKGVVASKGEWIIFIDSDNEMLPNTFHLVNNFASKNPDSPCLLFRCIDELGDVIGDVSYPRKISLTYQINNDIGELLGIFKRSVYILSFSDPVIEKLRRFEAVGVFRAMRDYGCFDLSNKTVRLYKHSPSDRLCSAESLKKDACFLAQGNKILVLEFHQYMNRSVLFKKILKILYYSFICIRRRVYYAGRS